MYEQNIINQNLRQEYAEKCCSCEDAVKLVHSGDHVYIGSCTSMAFQLVDALAKRRDELKDVTIGLSQFLRSSDIISEQGKEHFRISSYFVGQGERKAMNYGMTDFTSFHLSQVDIWCSQIMHPDVAFFEVSAPDENGYMNFGASGVALHEHVRKSSKKVILQVNRNVPWVCGEDNMIHVSEADIIAEADDELATLENSPFDDTLSTISEYILEQIPDGATIQLGLGGTAAAIGYGLAEKNDLGIHSELMTNSMMFLMKNGNINNRKKTWMPGKSVISFALGSKELYEFLDHNEDIYFMPFTKVNDPNNVAKNDNMISINTAMAIDLFGQVAADSIGFRQQSSTGGQLDFVRGAQMSKGGKSFIAITSAFTDKNGTLRSRITLGLPYGTAVTTPRSDVQYIVTEYGAVNLKVLTMKERVRAMISLAHPDFRDQLTDEAKENGLL